MKKEDLRIVYMGTPEFAVAPLKKLIENDYHVVGVVTMPDKPAGRGYQLQMSAVKVYALEQNLPLLQPEKLKEESFLEELRKLNADMQIVVAFRMLPKVVWDMPRLGTFNLHASLLPQYRGAAPINWAIINGEKETGVTTFFLTEEIDTGNILLQREIPISDSDNAGSLHDKLMTLGAETVTDTVDFILTEKPIGIEQNKIIGNKIEIKSAPKIFKETCKINWENTCESIHNFVRGLAPYPSAHTEILDEKGNMFFTKIIETTTEICTHNEACGSVLSDGKHFLKIAAKDGYVFINQLQIAGKKAMKTEELLRGFRPKTC